MKVPGKNEKWNDTDYDIPKFSYPSAFLIFSVTFLLTCFSIWISNGNHFCVSLVLSISLATTTSYARFFIDTKRKWCKEIYLLWSLLFFSSFVILQFVKF